MFLYWQQLRILFLGIKLFCFSRCKAETFRICLIKNFVNKLNELKFYEISRSSVSKRFWKFQLSILKNKKVLSLIFFLNHCQYQNKKALFTDPIFSEGFAKENTDQHTRLKYKNTQYIRCSPKGEHLYLKKTEKTRILFLNNRIPLLLPKNNF